MCPLWKVAGSITWLVRSEMWTLCTPALCQWVISTQQQKELSEDTFILQRKRILFFQFWVGEFTHYYLHVKFWHGCWKHCWGPGTIGHMSALYCTALYTAGFLRSLLPQWLLPVNILLSPRLAPLQPGCPTAPSVTRCVSHHKVQKEDFAIFSVLICL